MTCTMCGWLMRAMIVGSRRKRSRNHSRGTSFGIAGLDGARAGKCVDRVAEVGETGPLGLEQLVGVQRRDALLYPDGREQQDFELVGLERAHGAIGFSRSQSKYAMCGTPRRRNV